MKYVITRRRWLLSALSVTCGVAVGGRIAAADEALYDLASFRADLAQLEKQSGGRLGVAFLDTATGARVGQRADERFPLCSTFKLLAAGAVLLRVDHKDEHMDRIVRFSQKEIVPNSPVTETRVGDAGMSVQEICAAAITRSDNTAGNLLLGSIGGPTALTAFARFLKDEMTRLDRIEPDLNEALPNDPRDTSTPAAMMSDLHALVLGDVLSMSSRDLLTGWLVQNQTGNERLRAGLPEGWTVGDKTGSGERGTTNDLAIVWPPDKAPVLVSVYLTGAVPDPARRNRIIAAVARGIAAMRR
jgi:beta-lactamase class A